MYYFSCIYILTMNMKHLRLLYRINKWRCAWCNEKSSILSCGHRGCQRIHWLHETKHKYLPFTRDSQSNGKENEYSILEYSKIRKHDSYRQSLFVLYFSEQCFSRKFLTISIPDQQLQHRSFTYSTP